MSVMDVVPFMLLVGGNVADWLPHSLACLGEYIEGTTIHPNHVRHMVVIA